jgi:hypothetical protein
MLYIVRILIEMKDAARLGRASLALHLESTLRRTRVRNPDSTDEVIPVQTLESGMNGGW